MKVISTFKELKLGDKVAWRFIKISEFIGNQYYDYPAWVCISQVKGFHKKTEYPKGEKTYLYSTKEIIDFDILALVQNDRFPVFLLPNLNQFKKELSSGLTYDSYWEVSLLENEQDYNHVLKHLVAFSL